MKRLLFPLLLAACPAEPTVENDPEPELRILAPQADDVVEGDTVSVQIELLHAELTEPDAAFVLPHAPPSARPGGAVGWLAPTAHAHDPSDVPEGYLQVQLGDSAHPPQWASAFDLDVSQLPSGEHALQIELRWPDGHGFFPPVNDSVVIVRP